MQVIRAIKNVSFSCPIFGEGLLEASKNYYAFGKFARDISSLGSASIEKRDPEIVRLNPRTLGRIAGGESILMIHSGGYGDTISIGILLELLNKEFGIDFTICCHQDKWRSILKPMGFNGRWVPYPPELEILKKHDYLLADLYQFVDDHSLFLKKSPIKLLSDAFGVNLDRYHSRFHIPESIKKKMHLPHSDRIRLGVNFDSNGVVKSYPGDLQPTFVNGLSSLDFELFFFGKKNLFQGVNLQDGLKHNYINKTSVLELACLLYQMDYVIGVDSFVAHLAGILGKKGLVLHSTTNRDYFDHYKGITSISSCISCAPCYHVGDTCPAGLPSCRAFSDNSIFPDKILFMLIEALARNNRI
jgi:hypothetical protein